MAILQEKSNFDPFAGRKLYSHLFTRNLAEIEIKVAGHHVIYGDLMDSDAFNWLKKAEIAAAANIACAYLGIQNEIDFDKDIPNSEILKYQDELTNF